MTGDVKRKDGGFQEVGSIGQKRVKEERDIPLAPRARLLSKQERMLR